MAVTNEDLAWMRDRGNDLHKQAAAEIRDLRAANAKLREYVVHKKRICASRVTPSAAFDPCTCGLDDILARKDDHG